ncbi:MAG: hypothetical protein LBP27_05145, partial [Treponema sp.]|nr:hypothetical protein [Treponema sp.]
MKQCSLSGFFLPNVLLTLFAGYSGLFAAPLDSGYALAPGASATAEERDEAVREARFRVLAAAGKYEKTPYRYGG